MSNLRNTRVSLLSLWMLSCGMAAIVYGVLTPRIVTGQDAKVQAEAASNKGQEKLDEASSLKLEANTPAKLAKVVELIEAAIKDGLDTENTKYAKELLAASAFQKAKLAVQLLPRMAPNQNQLRKLKTDLSTDLKKALDNDPTLAEAHVLAAQVDMLPPADSASALKHVNDAIELQKDSPAEQSASYVLRARLKQDPAEQLDDYRKATQADSSNMTAWQLQIAMQVSMGKLDEAYQDIQKLLANDEGNQFAIEAAFQILVKQKRLDELLVILDKQIDAKPMEGTLRRLRATIFVVKSAEKNDKELMQKARADLDKAVELNKNDAQSLILRSQILFDLGEIDQARRDISDALLIEPEAIDGVFMRAAIAAREKRYADAIADMELLVRAFPTREHYVRQLANYYQLDERPRLAIRLLDELIKKNKSSWRSLRMRGDARLSTGEHSEAIKDYERAIGLMEKVAEKNKDANAPETDTDEESDDSLPKGEHAGILNNLAWVLATSPKDDIRNGKRALELGLKACEISEYKEAHILSTLAAGYAEIGDFENARKWSAKAVEIGQAEGNEQLEQLKKELENYKQDKAWREEQKTEENKRQRAKTETIET